MKDPEAAYVASVGEAHRRRFGQFMTPDPIARFMVGWALRGGARSLHDPAFGLGAFEAQARMRGVRCTGHEVDPAIAAHWRSSPGGAGRGGVKQADYLLDWGQGGREAVVCNPPYVRFHGFAARAAAIELIRRRTGVPLPGNANMASAFLVKSLSELAPGGRAAYVMPLEFLNAAYGRAVKARLLADGGLVALIRVACEAEAFPDAVTTVGIVLHERGAGAGAVRFASVAALSELDGGGRLPQGADEPAAGLDPAGRWLPLFDPAAAAPAPGLARIGDYGRFRRGIVSGANAFFALRPSQVRALGLRDGQEALPCVTRSADVAGPVLDGRRLRALEAADARVRLFAPGDPPSPAALARIATGEGEGVHLRHQTSRRAAWHRTERHGPDPLWVGTFSRGGYKPVLNRAGALSLACYHGFVPARDGRRWVDRLFLYLLSDAGRRLLALTQRAYGGGLAKFEPGDLNAAHAPSRAWLAGIPASAAALAIEAVARDGRLPAAVNRRFDELVSDRTAAPIMDASDLEGGGRDAPGAESLFREGRLGGLGARGWA